MVSHLHKLRSFGIQENGILNYMTALTRESAVCSTESFLRAVSVHEYQGKFILARQICFQFSQPVGVKGMFGCMQLVRHSVAEDRPNLEPLAGTNRIQALNRYVRTELFP